MFVEHGNVNDGAATKHSVWLRAPLDLLFLFGPQWFELTRANTCSPQSIEVRYRVPIFCPQIKHIGMTNSIVVQPSSRTSPRSLPSPLAGGARTGAVRPLQLHCVRVLPGSRGHTYQITIHDPHIDRPELLRRKLRRQHTTGQRPANHARRSVFARCKPPQSPQTIF